MKKYLLCINLMMFNLCSTVSPELYIDLLKNCLLGLIYHDGNIMGMGTAPEFNENKRENGLDWPALAHSMIGLKRMNNIQFCYDQVRKDNVPGDLIETGVWRGGATIFMRGLLKAYNDLNRVVWVADSFEGLPKPNVDIYPADNGLDLYIHNQLAISLEVVKENFNRYGLLDNQVRFLKGWFKDTLPSAPIKNLCILRLDGDLYESTIQALEALYPKLSPNGYVIIDDYFTFEACKKAVQDYRKTHGITEEIINIDNMGAYWKKAPIIRHVKPKKSMKKLKRR